MSPHVRELAKSSINSRDASGRELAAAHLTGGDPYSFTAPILAWAAGKAAAGSVHAAGALGPAGADAGFHHKPASYG
jgi:hypothetical protein